MARFTIPVSIRLSELQIQQARKLVNLANIGMENCNVYENGTIVTHPNINLAAEEKLCAIHSKLCRSTSIDITVELDELTGELTFSI